MANGRGGLILVALTLVVGCGGSGTDGPSGSSSGGTCTVTLSGAVTSTGDCGAQLDEATSAGTVNSLSIFTLSPNDDVFDFTVQPVATMTGAYATGSPEWVHGGSVENDSTAGKQEWNIFENDPPGPGSNPNVGTYNLKVTGISSAPVMTIAGVKLWSVEGTLDATLGPRASTGATGDVTVHVAFHDKTM
jgi:hypothetical protein